VAGEGGWPKRVAKTLAAGPKQNDWGLHMGRQHQWMPAKLKLRIVFHPGKSPSLLDFDILLPFFLVWRTF
jgi:hypothetical protein